jgi:hypothetical protein
MFNQFVRVRLYFEWPSWRISVKVSHQFVSSRRQKQDDVDPIHIQRLRPIETLLIAILWWILYPNFQPRYLTLFDMIRSQLISPRLFCSLSDLHIAGGALYNCTSKTILGTPWNFLKDNITPPTKFGW